MRQQRSISTIQLGERQAHKTTNHRDRALINNRVTAEIVPAACRDQKSTACIICQSNLQQPSLRNRFEKLSQGERSSSNLIASTGGEHRLSSRRKLPFSGMHARVMRRRLWQRPFRAFATIAPRRVEDQSVRRITPPSPRVARWRATRCHPRSPVVSSRLARLDWPLSPPALLLPAAVPLARITASSSACRFAPPLASSPYSASK